MTVDYLFVVDNSEPKYSICKRSIDMIEFMNIRFQKWVYKNFTFNHLFTIKLLKEHVFEFLEDQLKINIKNNKLIIIALYL